ncbi:MAG: hypothetical protein M1831_002182 [Alyxoria varia]|nr:MAG: hypothetical protein M1831_002182 [Alyxoria varia]
MSNIITKSPIVNPEPPDYIPPRFPSLYWPFPLAGTQSSFLFRPPDIWKFTLYWTLIFYGAIHLTACGFAVVLVGGKTRQNYKWLAGVVLLYAIVSGVEGVVSGSVVGGL